MPKEQAAVPSINSQVRILKTRYRGYTMVHAWVDIITLTFITGCAYLMYLAGHWDLISR